MAQPANTTLWSRRQFLSTTFLGGLALAQPLAWGQDKEKPAGPKKPATNIADAEKTPKKPWSLPGKFPGKVVEVHNPKVTQDKHVDTSHLSDMFQVGLEALTKTSYAKAFQQFFTPKDIVGIKVNPVGAGTISTHTELVHKIIAWLTASGLPKKNIVIWDRFDYMLHEAGFTKENFPGIRVFGAQTMDTDLLSGKRTDNGGWLTKEGTHVSLPNFDQKAFYYADIDAPTSEQYLHQHVVNGKYSYFPKLVSQELTKIINVATFKNTGNGISMATKNLGYGAICNTGRLHQALFFDVCAEVLGLPPIRDKLVLNITDGLIGQYEGGPMPAPQYTYTYNRLFFATDPFALDRVCHDLMVAKRKEQKIKVNEHPIFSAYFDYAQRLGLGITDKKRISHVTLS